MTLHVLLFYHCYICQISCEKKNEKQHKNEYGIDSFQYLWNITSISAFDIGIGKNIIFHINLKTQKHFIKKFFVSEIIALSNKTDHS